MTKTTCASVLSAIYICAIAYVIKRRAPRNILLLITIFMLLASVLELFNAINYHYLYGLCLDGIYDGAGVIAMMSVLIFSQGGSWTFFNLGTWMLIYKYWEVSWIVPI